VCLWEALTSRKLFKGDNEGSVLEQVLFGPIDPPSRWVPSVPPQLDALVMRGLERDKTKRFATAREFALALERAVHPALASDVGDWVENVAGDVLNERAAHIAEIESVTDSVPAMGLTEVMSGLGDAANAVPSAPTSGMIGGSSSGVSSQVSSISVAAGEHNISMPPKRRIPLWIGIGASVVALLVVVIVIASAAHSSSTSAAGASSASADIKTRLATATTSEPVATATFTATMPATATATAVATASATTTSTAKSRPQPTAHVNVTAPAGGGDDCKVPYTVGSNGEKIWKRHCFQ
jgi:serine/threonine-protein kinase